MKEEDYIVSKRSLRILSVLLGAFFMGLALLAQDTLTIVGLVLFSVLGFFFLIYALATGPDPS